jgi:CBS domain-containing protein
LPERDIVRAVVERSSSALEEPVGEVMARKVLTCSETDTVGELM